MDGDAAADEGDLVLLSELLYGWRVLQVLGRQVDQLDQQERPAPWMRLLNQMVSSRSCRERLREEQTDAGDMSHRILGMCMSFLGTEEEPELQELGCQLAANALAALMPVTQPSAWEEDAGFALNVCVSVLDGTDPRLPPVVALTALQHLMTALAPLLGEVSSTLKDRLGKIGQHFATLVQKCEDEDMVNRALLHCFPAWAKLFPALVDATLGKIVNKALEKDAAHVLCALAEYLFPAAKPSQVTRQLLESESFWKLVQEGCCSQDSCQRKRAQFLLKRAVDSCKSGKIRVTCTAFRWDPSAAAIEEWTNILGILQVLEEKQVHVIKPVLGKLNAVLEAATSERLDLSWYFLLLGRTFIHESGFIVRWGVVQFLSGSWCKCDAVESFIMGPLLQTLSQPMLYSDDQVIDALLSFFERIWDGKQEWAAQFLPQFLDAVSGTPRDPLALFYIVKALNRVPSVQCSSGILRALKETLSTSVQTRSGLLRLALHRILVLELPVRFLDMSSVDLDEMASLLGCCSSSPRANVKAWNNMSGWLKNAVTSDAAAEFVSLHFNGNSNRVDVHSAVHMFLLLSDAQLIDMNSFVSPLLDNLDVSPDRLYGCIDMACKSLKFLICLMEEAQHMDSSVQNAINSLIAKRTDSLVQMAHRMWSPGVTNLDDMDNLEVVFTFLESVRPLLPMEAEQSISRVALEKASNVNSQTPMEYYVGIKAIGWLVAHPHGIMVSEIILKQSLKPKWGKLSSRITCSLWNSWSNHLRYAGGASFSKGKLKSLLDDALDSLLTGSHESLPHIMECLQFVLPSLALGSGNMWSTCEAALDSCWKACLQLRKNRAFWTTASSFVRMAFHPKLLSEPHFQDIATKYGLLILSHGENIRGLANLLLDHLTTSIQDGLLDISGISPDVLLEAVVFGPLLRKDHRLLDRTCERIASEGEDFSDTVPGSHQANSMVRVAASEILLQMDGPAAQGMCILILSRMKQERERRRRYFGDSTTHRVLHRCMQALLILQPSLTADASCQLMEAVSQQLTEENSQPSVRYMQEWLLVRVMVQHEKLRERLWCCFERSTEEKVGSLVSFVSVAVHLARCLDDNKFLEKCIQNILPWCMAQNFNVRVYSQVALGKLWEVAKGTTRILEKYDAVVVCLQRHESVQGNAARNLHKLQEDFYFSTFHPMHHFSAQTIFYELPRLARISCDEWILPELFSDMPRLPKLNPTHDLEGCESAQWVVKAAGETELDECADADFQVKISPCKGMEELVGSAQRGRPPPSSSQLVLVASLIERMPNLGGLCRTCEAFGVSKLVVGSLRCVQDQQFRNLSVSAERWVSLEEVPVHSLPDFMKSMKQKGYLLVGAEQTARSTELHQFKFPAKTLLLLGNEKEGIPVEILGLLDKCVNIPQHGFIRSLNVHVAGALFVWEHTRQNLSSK